MDRRKLLLPGLIILIGILYWQRTLIAGAIYKTLPARAKNWIDEFKRADVDNRLPEGMTGKIAMIESSFNPNAISPVGAAGLMQIVPSQHPNATPTDPVKSIAYAGQYLRYLYNRFGDWNKAIAAYNWGEGNLSKAIAQSGDNWFNALPTETKKYLVKYNSIKSFS